MIVLVTNEDDATCDLVVLRLRARGIPYLRLNTDGFLTSGGLTWSLDTGSQYGHLRWREATIDLATISAVWYRRPVAPRPPEAVRDPSAQAFAVGESSACLHNLWSLLGGLWVSPPAAIRIAEAKLLQLLRADQLGFEVPTTLLTDDPDQARHFCFIHGNVIAKPIGRATVDASDRDAREVVFATALGKDDFARLDAVAQVATFFQQRIPKVCDIRVTVVGDQVFAAEIHAPANSTDVDWRREPLARLRHARHALPDSLSERVLALVRGFGLQFGALDFVLTPDGRYVFLELNPNGQWAWLELVLGLPIADTLVDLLSGRTLPL